MKEVIPIATETAPSWFNTIRHGINIAIENSGGYVSSGDVFRQLTDGNWMLYIGMEDNDYVGFAVVEFLDSAKGKWVNVPFASTSTDMYDTLFSHLIEQADLNGMAGVKFVSSRKGFERVAEKHGWRMGFTEYIVKDFTGGN